MDLRPFNPRYGANAVVAPAAGSAVMNINPDDMQVRVCNSGAAIGYFKTYSSATTPTPTASAADCPVLPGTCVVVTVDGSHDRLAYQSTTGTTFQIQTGNGGFN
jgi:hypothetical protein